MALPQPGLTYKKSPFNEELDKIIDKYPVLERKEEIEVAEILRDSRNDLAKYLIGSEYAIRTLYEQYEKKRDENKDKKTKNSYLFQWLKKAKNLVPELGELVDRLDQGDQDNSLIEKGREILIELGAVNPKTFSDLMQSYTKEYQEIGKIKQRKKETKQKKSKAILEKRIQRLERKYKRTFGKNWQQTYEPLYHIHQIYEKARNTLFNSNLRLVYDIARKYKNSDLNLEELVLEGMVGLIKAVDKFDPERGNKFSTYATWLINQPILLALKNQRVIRIPPNLFTEVNRAKRIMGEFFMNYGRYPTVEELSHILNFNLEKTQSRLSLIRFTELSLDQQIRQGEENFVYFLEDQKATNPRNSPTYFNDLRKALRNSIKKFDSRTEKIFIMKYDLDGKGERTLEQVGKEVGLTRERVRQIIKKYIEKLRRKKHPLLKSFLSPSLI